MASTPFEDPLAKVDNAKGHIGLVQDRFQAFVKAGPSYRVDESGGNKIINFGSGLTMPKSIPMATGDAIHNLRSALDIMAGDVVQASSGRRKGVCFPFARDEGSLDAQIKDKRFDRAIPEAVELLKSFKPYKGGNAELRALHDLDLTDKHNFVIPAERHHRVSMQVGNVTLINCTSGGNLGGDISIGRGAPFSVPDITPKLIFAPNQPFSGMEVIPSLHRLAHLTQTIIEAFAALFKEKS